jgi:flagellar biosynthesis/type III secretory pathway chaperone
MALTAGTELAAQIETLVARLQGIGAQLEQERRAIAAGDVAAIEACNQAKQSDLDQLNSELGSVFAGLGACDESPDIEGLGRLLQARGAGDTRWRALQQRLTKALENVLDQNQVNGYLAYTGQREATALLGLLLRDSAGTTTDDVTYDPSGKTASPSLRGRTSRKA